MRTDDLVIKPTSDLFIAKLWSPPEPPKLTQVLHFELYGKREDKYDFLRNQSLRSVSWKTLELVAPQFFFAVKDFSLQKE